MTSTHTRPWRLSQLRPALLAPAVVAIVLGILGMHGVDAHGVNLHGTVAHAGPATSSTSVMLVRDPGSAERASADVGDADGMSGMTMLCVVMLSGVTAALLGLLARVPRLWAVLQLPGRVKRPEARILRVGTGPPSVWRFSVIRC